MIKKLVFPLLLLTAGNICAKDYLAADFKIDNQGTTLVTVPLQKAIDKIAASGGGRLVFAPGTYLTGSIMLKTGVELHLLAGATLLGSPNSLDYIAIDKGEGNTIHDENTSQALIVAENSDNIRLTGQGTIDGNGLAVALCADSLHHAGIQIDKNYNVRRHRTSTRPKLFYFHRCKNILVENLNLRSSAGWGLSFNQSSHITLINLKVENRAYWNNDGIDISDCQHVYIGNCDVNAADDGICLKSHDESTCCDSITIENCRIRSSASAVKFGTASFGGFRNVSIRNIRVVDTFRSAIALESVDGGTLENISVEDVTAYHTGNAIFIRLGARNGKQPGKLQNVSIRRLYCQVPFGRPDINYDLRGPEVNFFHNPFPSSITGLPGNRAKDILIEDVEIVYPGRATKGMAYLPLYRLDDVPEAEKDYPEFTMFGELPAWAFYVRHVEGITFRNVKVRLTDSDFRPAFVFDDVKQLHLQDIYADGTDKDKMFFKNVEMVGNNP